MSKLDGGPAFPFTSKWVSKDGETTGPHLGMSLRDWFAGTAHPDILSVDHGMSRRTAAALVGVEPEDYNPSKHWPQIIARAKYLYADAMLKARTE